MKRLDHLKMMLSKHKKVLQKKYHIKRLGLFGSYVRGEENQQSDLDILVDFDQPIGLEFVSLAEELESLLNIRIDLVSTNAVKPRMMKSIEEELIYV